MQREIEAKTDQVKHEEERLQSIQNELDNKQDTLESLTATVNGQLRSTNKTLNDENGKLADYDKELARLDQLQKELAAKVASAHLVESHAQPDIGPHRFPSLLAPRSGTGHRRLGSVE